MRSAIQLKSQKIQRKDETKTGTKKESNNNQGVCVNLKQRRAQSRKRPYGARVILHSDKGSILQEDIIMQLLTAHQNTESKSLQMNPVLQLNTMTFYIRINRHSTKKNNHIQSSTKNTINQSGYNRHCPSSHNNSRIYSFPAQMESSSR